MRAREYEREKSRVVSWFYCEKGFHRAEPLEGSRELPGPKLHGETLAQSPWIWTASTVDRWGR